MADRPRRARRRRDVPRELHKRIEQLERRDLHPTSRRGLKARELGFVVPLDDGAAGLSGWGWAGLILTESLNTPGGLAGWGWADQALASDLGVAFATGWGWADQANGIALTSPQITAGWGWAGQAAATNISRSGGVAGWGWSDQVTASIRSEVLSADADDLGPLAQQQATTAGWGWAGQVSATNTSTSDTLGAETNMSELNNTELN